MRYRNSCQLKLFGRMGLPNLIGITLLVLIVSACSMNNLPWAQQEKSILPTVTVSSQSSGGAVSPTLPAINQDDSSKQALTIWLPPEFDAGSGGMAGILLDERLKQFSKEHEGIIINTRIKDNTGAASLLNSLESTSTAAPSGLPSLIALQRADFEIAALKGLIYPIENHDELVNDADKFKYARELEMIRGTPYGIAFAGDAMVLIYRPAVIKNPPRDWKTLFESDQPLAFPAGDPQALLPVSAYLSLGGMIQDQQNRPIIEKELIENVFGQFAEGARLGIFPVKLLQLANEDQAWSAYTGKEYEMAVAWISHYLSEHPADSMAILVPPLSEIPISLSDGWVWAVSDSNPENRETAIELAKFLMDRNFLNQWTVAAGYLPVRPSGVGEWTNRDIQNLISAVISSAQIIPRNDILSTVGPILQDEMSLVIRREVDPFTAAESAAQKIYTPGTE
jgi:multiple sugar transport system substrate-binding protein